MNVIPAEKREMLLTALRAGLSIRKSAVYAGVKRTTAARYFYMLPPMTCPCGRSLPHRGWCDHRSAISAGHRRRAQIRSENSAEAQANLLLWRPLIIEIQAALRFSKGIARLEEQYPGIFQMPEAAWADDARVPIQQPANEISVGLMAALDKLHPKVKRFVLAIVDGESLEDAASENDLSDDDLGKILPKLKAFLAPHLKS